MEFKNFGDTKIYLQKLENERQNNRKEARKRRRFDELKVRNQRKLLRNSGQEYVNSSKTNKRIIQEKKFILIQNCCPKNCHLKFDEEVQREIFEYFWNLTKYPKQNIYLFGLLEKIQSSETVLNQIQNGSRRKPKFCRWNYHLDVDGIKTVVCLNLFLNIFQISSKRLSILQSKILNGKSFSDGRGHHDKHKKIPDQTWNLISQFINKLPTTESHYSLEKSHKKYFENCRITLTWLFDSCNEILENNLEQISYRSFKDFYDSKFNIGFTLPKTDVCDLCFEMNHIGYENLSQEQKLIFDKHKADFQQYKNIKSSILISDLTNKLVLEFDYGQNKALPKLNNNSTFFRRCLWFYLFNVYIHNTKQSFMYHMIEGQFKKGSNSVTSYLLETLKKFDLSNCNEMILFSDSCPGQNKNSTLFKSLIFFANYFNVKITHYYPVKGHSYCVCDRQFGLFTKKLKNIDVIFHPDEYLEILDQLHFNCSLIDILNFEKLYAKIFNIKLNIKIKSLKKIEYLPNGKVQCYEQYDSPATDYNYSGNLTVNWINLLEKDDQYFISKEKTKDVLDLVHPLPNEKKAFYTQHLAQFSIENYKKC